MSSNWKEETEVRANPYVGPRFFVQDDKDWFYGRDQEASELLSLLTARRLVLFFAQSGAGKTSLINARLLPMLETAQGGFELLPVGRVGDSLMVDVEIKNQFAFNLMVSLGVSVPPEQLAGLDLADFLLDLAYEEDQWVYINEPHDSPNGEEAPAVEEGEADHSIKPRALIIDQFEEILTMHPELEEERIAFFQQIGAAMEADPYLYVLLSMREDYIAQISPYANHLPGGLRTRYYMQRMRHEAALDAVRLPAQKGGREFSADVPEKLVRHLRRVHTSESDTAVDEPKFGPYVEPVQLQVVCYQLWQSVQEAPGQTITMRDVNRAAEQLAGEKAVADPLAAFVDTALAGYYEQALKRVLDHKDVSVSEYELRDWFSEALITSAGVRNLVVRGGTDTAGMPETVIRLLDEKHHLIRNEMRGGHPFVELVHDSFVNPIRQANQRWRETQTRNIAWLSAAYQYSETKDPVLLIAGEALAQAQQQAQTMNGLPTEAEAYLKASEDAQREQHLRDSERRSKFLFGMVGLLMVAVVIVLFLLASARSSNIEAQTANTRQAQALGTATAALATAAVAQNEAENNLAAATVAQGQAEYNLATATVAQGEAINNLAIAAAAQADAEQQRLIAESFRLAGQSQENLEEGNFEGSLLLAIEAKKRADTVTAYAASTQIEKNATQDFVQGALLMALNRQSRFSGDQIFRADGVDSQLYVPITKTLWVWQNSEMVSVTLPNNNITQMAISGDGETLIFANDKGEIAWSQTPPVPGDFSLASMDLLFHELPLDLADVEIKDLALNQAGDQMAMVACASIGGEENCTLQLWIMDGEEGPIRDHEVCEPTVNNATTTVFLAHNSELVWSDAGNLFSLDFQTGSCDPIRVTIPQDHFIQDITYLPGNDPSTGLLFTASGYPICPECGGSLQWWRVRTEGEDTQISQIGSPLETDYGLTAVQPVLDSPGIIVVDQFNHLTWYNAAMTDWQAIACELAGRNLTADEWEMAYPARDFDSAFSDPEYEYPYQNTCDDYDLHISFADDKLEEAETEMETCADGGREAAEQLFRQAVAYASAADETRISENTFESWGGDVLLHHLLEDNPLQFDNCLDQLALLFRNNDGDAIDQEALETLVNALHEIEDDFEDILSENTTSDYEPVLQALENLVPQIAQLETEFQPVFTQELVSVYDQLCINTNVTEACQSLIEMTDHTIAYDESVEATTEERPFWRFTGQVSETVAITMNAEEDRLDPLLRVFDAEGNIIASNDDSGGSLNSLILLTLPQSDDFYINASRWGSTSGAYSLTLMREIPAISMGETVSGNAATTQIWQLDLQAGDVISMAMEATGTRFDPSLVLLDTSGDVLASQFGDGFNRSVAISVFIAPQTGAYYLLAGSGGENEAPYELKVKAVSTRPLPLDQTEPADTGDSTIWTFPAEAGDMVTVTLTTSDNDLNPTLILRNGQGRELGYAEADFDTSSVSLANIPILQSGSYYVEVGTDDGASGAYELALTQGSILRQITIGERPATADEAHIWQFEGTAGTPIAIVMEATGDPFYPVLELRDEAGQSLTQAYSNEEGTQAQIAAYVLPANSSTFFVYARGDRGAIGPYTLAIETVEALALNLESEVISVTATTLSSPLWQFTGEAGDRVTIDLESPNEFFDPYLTLIGPNGDILMRDDDSGDGPRSYDARIREFELPEDGVYYILAGRANNEEEFTLTLRIQEAE